MQSDLRSDEERRRREIAYEQAYEDDVVNYVPGEICIVVSSDHRFTPKQLHDAIRGTLNQSLTEFLRRGADIVEPIQVDDGVLRQALIEDLRFPLVRKRFRSLQKGAAQKIADILLPLNRLPPGTVPIVTLPRGELSTSIVVFQIEPDVSIDPELPKAVEESWLDKRHRLVAEVRELVIIINQQLRGAANHELHIAAATPNWLTTVSASSAGGHGCGSPGGLPRAIDAGHVPTYLSRLFEFDNDRLREFERQAQRVTERHVKGESSPPTGVVVAVLDTSPSASQVRAAAESSAFEGADNWLLPLVASRLAIDGALSEPEHAFKNLVYRPNWHGPECDHATFPDDAAFVMADHGLFVAGVVYHLAPAAEIHLIRVLDEFGVGDMLAISQVLRRLPGDLLVGSAQRLVVNLSLGAELPPIERFPIRWFPNLAKTQHLPASGPVADFVAGFRDLIHAGLRETIAWLSEQGILVVAAAGNDRYVPPIGRKDPRYPAGYNSVLGVAALKEDDKMADYTNQGDEPSPTVLNGIATFGGNATLVGGPGNGPALTDLPPNAVKGIFSARQLPLHGGRNETGWVDWAGTSFSTPIITAIAANIWADDIAHHGTMEPADVMRAIFSLSGSTRIGPVPVISARVP